MCLDYPFVPSFDVAEREGVECVRRALEQLGGEIVVGVEPIVDAGDEGEEIFVDVVGSEQRDEGAASEWVTFADALLRANFLSETLLDGVVSSSELPLC